MAKTNILLESGTNEFEFIEFRVNTTWYGLNVAKIREIILMVDTIKAANMHPSVIGIFDHRGAIIPIIDLAIWFNKESSVQTEKRKILICELNGNYFGFVVDFVSQIRQVSWKDLHSPQKIIACSSSAIIGVVRQNKKIILMLDIEKIANDIEPISAFKIDQVENPHNIARNTKRIFFADDSMLIRNTIKNVMPRLGYNNLVIFENGKELIDRLEIVKKDMEDTNSNLENFVDAIVTDVEMPQVDGLHLLKKIREDKTLKNLPVIVFSSISNKMNKEKSLKLGANTHVSKPDLKKLVESLDLIFQNHS